MSVDLALDQLAESNFQRERQEIFARTDRMFARVMAIQYALGIVFAFASSPRTWAGGTSTIHPHVLLAILLGGALASFPIVLAIRHPGETATRYTVAVSQGLFSALLIHLSGGRIETHFHVFGSLAFLAMYRDQRLLLMNSAIVAVDHALRGLFFPLSIYGIGHSAEWRFIEHAGWVIFEDVFLLVACAASIRESRGLARRQAELEIANARIEQTAAEIGRQSAILNSVLTGMHDGVAVADSQGRFLHVNPAARRILGAELEGVPPEAWSERFGLSNESGFLYDTESLPLVRAMRGESVVHEEMRAFPIGTDRSVWLEIGAEPLASESGERMGGVAVFRDVTEQRRILQETAFAREEAERANRAKSEFLSRMSHELRTPMNAILGFGQILRMDELSADQEESLDQILRAGGHLLRLINEVLDLSGIESGKLTISKEPVDAIDALTEVSGMVRPLATTANVTLVLPLDGREAFLLADRQRLLQVLLNLVANAIKYNVPGGKVRIELEREDDRLRLVVQDTGPGIPEEKRARLFNPFDRLGAQGSSVEGTGLGLALSKRLVEAMGGEIGIRECPVGACFWVAFPVAQSPLRVVSNETWTQGATIEPTLGGSLDVLLVEDNAANVRLVERIMNARPSHRLHTAGSGVKGLEMARTHWPELVLLDLDLPDMHGSEILRLLRSDRRFEETWIVAVSADANPENADRLRALGADAFLTKPYDVDRLLATIDAVALGERHVA